MTLPAAVIGEKKEEEFQTGQVLTIVGGHIVMDTYSAFLAPILPLLIEKLSLSLTLAGSLLAFVALPGLLNPFIGYLADKVSLRYFVIFAPGVTATIFSVVGLAPNYFILAAILFLAGVSSAAFHSPAPAMIGRVSGRRVGRGMSLFMAGGELGRTVGPLLAVWAVSIWTLDGMYRVVVIGWAATFILLLRLRAIPARTEQRLSLREIAPSLRRLFIPLFIFVFLRLAMLGGLPVFLPTYMVERGASLQIAAAALSIFELAGVGGALLGGTLSDRLGRKLVIMFGTGVAAILLIVFVRAEGIWLVPLLLGMGFTVFSTQPVLLAVVQEHFPANRAVANGLFLSIFWVGGAMALILVGYIGDRNGLGNAFLMCAVLALIAVPLALLIPDIDKKQ